MEPDRQKLQLPIKIICDKVFYERIKSLEDNQSMKISLFPYKNQNQNTLNLALIDISKCSNDQQPDIQQFNKEQLISVCEKIYAEQKIGHILRYVISKESLVQLTNQQSQTIQIVSPSSMQQVNQALKQCIIVTLRLPQDFYCQKDCNYQSQGFKFNSKGKVTQTWSYVNNGKMTKCLLPTQNDKVKTEMRQNSTFSKNQLKTILQQILTVNNLSSKFDHKNLKIVGQLQVLGQNFYHSQKFINNAAIVLPVLNFQIQLLCSVFQGQSWRAKIASQASPIKNQCSVQVVCLNLSQGVQKCEQILKKKLQKIFSDNKKYRTVSSRAEFLTLTNMPTKIVNPHLFLKSEVKQKFSQYYVKGLYEYYHYGDHNFNDQGWGCAYRSLQSLLSWFRLQQKLNIISVPTVLQIQNMIDLIDCTSQQKLSNTNTWIGATQVSWIVKKLTGFDCRILHIKDGKDIVQHAEMFRDHLQNVGSPIMYGGDQYAYSIVGINYSWKLGQIKFLILDPHYNGSDKIDKIIEKKGVCWRKPEEMFKKGVFYNFCLPIL